FLASYLKATGTAGIWYKLDEGDADLSSFFYYLGMAVGQAVSPEPTMPL
ncbi:MAG: hypothetical protein GWO08_23100, partial [Gammaproteobacteria bacterium]|nr:hypothetical protein [Gammaproteobacteria bacterium]